MLDVMVSRWRLKLDIIAIAWNCRDLVFELVACLRYMLIHV